MNHNTFLKPISQITKKLLINHGACNPRRDDQYPIHGMHQSVMQHLGMLVDR
jgi:hypothetical protein